MQTWAACALHTDALWPITMAVRSALPFVASNVIGIGIFLFAASYFWIEPELANLPGANIGNAFGWILYAAPIAVLFVLGDLIWTAVKVVKSSWSARFQYIALSFAVLACWAAACIFDGNHHGV
jgi:hypothetical protein